MSFPRVLANIIFAPRHCFFTLLLNALIERFRWIGARLRITLLKKSLRIRICSRLEVGRNPRISSTLKYVLYKNNFELAFCRSSFFRVWSLGMKKLDFHLQPTSNLHQLRIRAPKSNNMRSRQGESGGDAPFERCKQRVSTANAAKQSFREREGRDQAGTVGPFSGIIMSSNGIP